MTSLTPPFQRLGYLVGREAEDQLIEQAYKRVIDEPSSCEAVLVHGESGTGKTALVQHWFQHKDGIMVSGKFDVIHSQKPYSPIVDALTQLCEAEKWNNITNERALQKELRKRLGAIDLKILANLVPAVELRLSVTSSGFIHEDSASDDSVGTSTSSSSRANSDSSTFSFSRFTEVVRSFLFVVTRFLPSPLILFLDDVQAADAESLSLISSLTSLHTETCNLLLILAYRDELHNDRMLQRNEILSDRTDFRVTDICVGNLDADALNKLISKLLGIDEENAKPLSVVVTQRTGGNVYFALQFLDLLKNDKLLNYCFGTYRWEWNLEKIHANTDVTENVAGLLTSKIKQLPLNVQSALQLAACLGFYFDVQFLERIAQLETADDVNIQHSGEQEMTQVPAEADESLVLPAVDESDHVVSEFRRAIAIAMEENLIDLAGETKYKFTHDRVLQAVYEMIPDGSEREMLHWRIGQVLWTELEQHKQQSQEPDFTNSSDDWLLFAAADQLNRGSDSGLLSSGCVTVHDLAKLNLEAGKAASEKSAFKHAAGFFDKGVNLMKDRWLSEYSLCLDLNTLSAETEYAVSNFEKCGVRIEAILENGRSLEDKLRAYLVKVQSSGIRGSVLDAIDDAVAVLRLLGERIPRRPNLFQILLELAKTNRALQKMELVDFISLPDMTDRFKIWAIKFLQNISLFSWFSGQNEALVVSVCRMVQLTVSHGVSSQAPSVLALYGVTLGYLGDLTSAYDVGRVAVELTKRSHTGVCYARALATVFAFLDHLRQPLARSLDHCMEGYNTGMKSGETEGAALCLCVYASLGMYLGKNLGAVHAEMEGFRQAYRDEIESNFTMMCLLPWHQFALNLMGRSDNPLKLTGEVVCEEAFLIKVRESGNEIAIATVNVARMMLLYIMCDIEGASMEVSKLDMDIVSKGTHFAIPFLLMYAALVMLAMARKTGKCKFSRRASLFKKIMLKFAKAGNLNMPPLLELVSAEQARYRRWFRSTPPGELKASYENAVRIASQSGFSVVEAMGNERAGEYMLSIGDLFWARTYFSRALLLYDEWGAVVKTQQMMEKYPFLADAAQQQSGRRNVSVTMRKRYNFKEASERRRLSLS